MATPYQNPRPSTKSAAPGSEPTAPTDAQQAIVVTIKLSGTAANLTSDWTTLTGTNFASPSAEIDWSRA